MNLRGKTPDTPREGAPIEDHLRGAIDRMRHAVVAAVNGTGASDAFQSAAGELISDWRGANVPPEQVLLRIKGILAEVGLRPTYATPTEPAPPVGARSEIYRDVIAWTIRHYYNGFG